MAVVGPKTEHLSRQASSFTKSIFLRLLEKNGKNETQQEIPER
jgi:hypothetical protein